MDKRKRSILVRSAAPSPLIGAITVPVTHNVIMRFSHFYFGFSGPPVAQGRIITLFVTLRTYKLLMIFLSFTYTVYLEKPRLAKLSHFDYPNGEDQDNSVIQMKVIMLSWRRFSILYSPVRASLLSNMHITYVSCRFQYLV